MHLNETLEDMAEKSCDNDDIASNSTLPSKIHIRSNNQCIYIRNTSVAPQEMNFSHHIGMKDTIDIETVSRFDHLDCHQIRG